MRKELDLFANIRPCLFPGKTLTEHSPLKAHIIEGVKFTVVRELTGGIYFGERCEATEEIPEAWDTMKYSADEIRRITRIACQLSMLESPPLHITSIDKANVLATSRLWRQVVTETIEKEFPTIQLSHNLVDSAAMHMLMNPRKLNGIVLTENMFGDILSDEASVIPGSLGLLPSASLNGWGKDSLGVYEPIHGSAPDIAGQGTHLMIQGIANPIGTILSAAMMLEYSLASPHEAKAIQDAVEYVLDIEKLRTRDLGGETTTSEMGDAICKRLESSLKK